MILDATEAGRRMALSFIGALQEGTITRGQYDEAVSRACFVPPYPETGTSLKEWRLEREIAASFRATITKRGPQL